MDEKKVIAYKGFDENLCCRGFQYEIGKEYELKGEIACCSNGFHACTNPFDVLNHYEANGKNRYCEVEQYGIIKSDNYDTKLSSSKIKIKAEIGMSGLFKAGIEWIIGKTNPTPIIKETKDKNDNSNSDYAQIGSSKDHDKIVSSGDFAQIGSSEECVQIGSSGDCAQIGSSGNYAQIGSSGNHAKIGSSSYSAKIGSSGDYAQIGSSGCYNIIESTGEDSVICCAGNNSMVKAKKGSWITLAEWKVSKDKKRSIPVCVKTEYVDGERIKEDTWYKLVDGEFKEQ